MRFISLKTKTAFWVVSLSVLTNGFLGSYLVWESYQALRRQAQESQLALAKTLAWEVDQGFSKASQAIQLYAKQDTAVLMNRKDLVDDLTVVTTATEFLDGILCYKPDGRLWAQSITTIPRGNFPPPLFIRGTAEKAGELRQSVLAHVYASSTNDIVIAMGTPIFRGEKLVGVLVGITYAPNHIVTNFDKARIGKSGYAFLVTQTGIALTHPNRTKWLKDLSANPAVAAFKGEKEGILQFVNEDGEEDLAAFAPVKSSGWGVIVRQPISECYEPANAMLAITTLFLVGTLLFSLFLSLFLSNRVAKPILELADKVRNYESGKLETREMESTDPTDEIGVLGHAIGRMAHTIQFQSREREKSYQRTLKAERKAAEAERLAVVGQLSAGLAHELNNPLAVILGAARMAGDARSQEKKKWLEEIHDQAERCRRLVSDLLNLAKPIRLSLRRTDLGRLAQETWERVPRPEAPCHLEMSPVRFEAVLDADRFQQVFFNLFRNAIEAMPRGGKVKVVFKKRGSLVRVLIADQGVGIPRRNQSKLFRPFFTTKPRGTGLGLTIVRSILQAHHGRIWVGSNRPRGVKITLEWPQN